MMSLEIPKTKQGSPIYPRQYRVLIYGNKMEIHKALCQWVTRLILADEFLHQYKPAVKLWELNNSSNTLIIDLENVSSKYIRKQFYELLIYLMKKNILTLGKGELIWTKEEKEMEMYPIQFNQKSLEHMLMGHCRGFAAGYESTGTDQFMNLTLLSQYLLPLPAPEAYLEDEILVQALQQGEQYSLPLPSAETSLEEDEFLVQALQQEEQFSLSRPAGETYLDDELLVQALQQEEQSGQEIGASADCHHGVRKIKKIREMTCVKLEDMQIKKQVNERSSLRPTLYRGLPGDRTKWTQGDWKRIRMINKWRKRATQLSQS